MAFSAKKRESTISLQYHYKDLELNFAARYGIDGKERMEVDDEPVVQLPHEVQLNVSDIQECQFQHDYSGIQDDVIGNMGFLKNFVDSPPVVMKTVRCIIVYLQEKDIHGIHLVPENEHLTITKVDEHGRTSAFIYRSNPAKDTITVSECQQINNFVGVHPKKKWLISVLWLLSELAVNQFGKQG
ncbi:uncharacterized protein [Pocillopora verrucosa]|uniref:uncharacterized protein n=1 Tax=Pocillopora verrucosa TaxID=203993 RepID=UPI003342A591